MRSRSFILVAIFLTLSLGGATAVYAYDSSRTDLIAPGVRVEGVDIGGLHAAAARARLRRTLVRAAGRPVVVRYHRRRFVLSARRARVRVDVAALVATAVARSRTGSILTRTVRGLRGARLDLDLAPRFSYSSAAVRRFVARAARAIDRSPRNARVGFSSTGLVTVSSHTGRRLQAGLLRRAVAAALAEPGSRRRLRARVRRLRPAVTTASLARRYAAVILINRSAFRLTLYRHLKPVKSYPIAVGRQGLETPAGLYHVQDKIVNPSWHVPKSSWAGALAGKVIPPGPQDPIKARWLGIYNGAGIHGTTELGSLGSAASHGCIRMAIPDVIELYDQVSVGAPVYIS